MKKQRWRWTKLKKCENCKGIVDTTKLYGVDDWSHKNKIIYCCINCLTIGA